jgi:3-oxoadipate enol-lactonase
LANDVRVYAETCRMLGAADKRDALKNFRMPCAILVGSEDYATPVAMARVLEAGIAGSRLEVIENARQPYAAGGAGKGGPRDHRTD